MRFLHWTIEVSVETRLLRIGMHVLHWAIPEVPFETMLFRIGMLVLSLDNSSGSIRNHVVSDQYAFASIIQPFIRTAQI